MSDPNLRYLKCLITDPASVTLPRALVNALVEMTQTETDGYTSRTLEPHRQAVLDYVLDQSGENERKAHLAYLLPFLKYDGERVEELNTDIHDEAMSLLDGYGKLDVDQLREMDLIWDCSHIRDSSVEALAECRAFIEGILHFATTEGDTS